MLSPKTMPRDDARRSTGVCILIAYEDFETGKRAQRVCREIAEAARSDAAIGPDAWKFDLLRLPPMRKLAVQEAAKANLLVLAPRDGEALPPFVLDWIRLSLQHVPRRPKVLLVLLGPLPEIGGDASPAELQLRTIGTQAKVSMRCLHLEPPNGEWSEPGYAPGDLAAVAQAISPRNPATSVPVQQGFIANFDG
jgi:hypothetical protein